MRSHPFDPRVAIVSLGVAFAPSSARAQDTLRVSTDSAGNEGNGWSLAASVEAYGQVICFTSAASNLVPSDTNQRLDVFVNDRSLGIVSRVSVDSTGVEGDGDSFSNSTQTLSGDGTACIFDSAATNLCANDTNGVLDVFVHDKTTGATVRVSVDSNGNQADHASYYGVISADAKIVAFVSEATNLVAGDTNGQRDVFVRDLATGATERVSVDSQGNEADGWSHFPSLSADGRYVAFTSAATNLVPGDTNQRQDVFLRDRVLGTTERVSLGSSGNEGDDNCIASSISSDGQFIAFDSWARNLVPFDSNSSKDVFLVDRAAGTIVRCSVDSSGVEGNGGSGKAVVSSTGALVEFESFATNLIANDGNAHSDVFVHDLRVGSTTRMSVDSNGGEANSASFALAISGDEQVVAFASYATNLVASDTNGAVDVFIRDRCAQSSWSNYGQGLAGTNGVPSLTANQDPVLGSTITVDLANSLGAPTVGVLLVGFEQGSFKTQFGADVVVTPEFAIPTAFSYGSNSFVGALSVDGAFCGTSIDLQAVELDPGAPYGMSFTQGLELDLGR